jgi:(S)-mandelate dehydrogenase
MAPMWPESRRFYQGGDLARMTTIEDLRHAAHHRLPGFITEYLEGGAEGEVTLRRNREAFSRRTFKPRMLVDVSAPDLSSTLFGQPLPVPMIIGPTGLNGFLTDQGDLHLAAAAATVGIPFAQSMVSMASIEAVAQHLKTPHWIQLYVLRNRDFALHLIERALLAGCSALVLTVDGPVYGNREWDKRNYARPAVLDWRNRFDALAHPAWLADVYRHGRSPRFSNVDAFVGSHRTIPQTAGWMRDEMDASLSWADVSWLRERWPGQLIIKGIMALADIQRAIDVGADGVVLSNHGGRQLDLVGSPLDLLPAAKALVAGRMALLVDSGIRRGSDIAQAIALGADAVLIGRAVLYGVAAAGRPGALRALRILVEELTRTACLLGCARLADLNPGIFGETAERPA